MNRIGKALHHRVAALVVAAGLLSGGQAFAFGDECFTFGPAGVLNCNTLAVRPNTSTHTLNMKVHSIYTTYQLVDNGNQIICREGRTGFGSHLETVGGLYNNQQGYILYCSSWTGDCELNNN
jgi:hypothetical protein